jgi:polygalacturonase
LKKIILLFFVTTLATVLFAQQKTYNIISFGAKGDGRTLNTLFIQKAIDKAAAAGGGKVIVPKGRFVTGTIGLKNGVNLFLERDAVLLGSTNRLDYGKEIAENLITTTDQKKVSITGYGEIDGQGREVVKSLFKLLHQGVLKDSQWKIKRPGERNRPGVIAFTGCTDVLVKGITVKNSAGWVQDYRNCSNVVIDSITVNSTEYWNNDGIDIVNSQNVSITNCYVDAADDGICLKSEGGPGFCENIYVANCTLRSSATAFKLGTGSRGGFRNITVKNLFVFDTYRSAIALEAVDGGFLENVDIQQVKAVNTGNAIFIRLGHRNTDSMYSTIKKIRIADVQIQVPAGKPDIGYPVEGPPQKYPHNVFPASIVGLPGHEVEDVELKNIVIEYEGGGAKEKAYFGWDSLTNVPENAAGYPEFSMFGEIPAWALYVRHAKGITLQNVQLKLQQPDYRPACIFDDVKTLQLNELSIPVCNALPVLILNNVKEYKNGKLTLPVEDTNGIKILNNK